MRTMLFVIAAGMSPVAAMDLEQANAWWGPMENTPASMPVSIQALVVNEPAMRLSEGSRVIREDPAYPDLQLVAAWQHTGGRREYLSSPRQRFGVRVASDRAAEQPYRPQVAVFASLNSGDVFGLTVESGWAESRGSYIDALVEVFIFDLQLHVEENKSWYGFGNSLRLASGGSSEAYGIEWTTMHITNERHESVDAFRVSAWGSYAIAPPLLLTAGLTWQSQTLEDDGTHNDVFSLAAGLGLVW